MGGQTGALALSPLYSTALTQFTQSRHTEGPLPQHLTIDLGGCLLAVVNMLLLSEKLQYGSDSDEMEAEFLFLRHDGLFQFTLETIEQIKDYFAPCYIIAEVHNEFTNGGGPALFLLINPSYDIDRAHDRLAQFDMNWWMKNLIRGGDRLHVNLA